MQGWALRLSSAAAHRSALYQLATGKGLADPLTGDPLVAPGQQSTFRDDSFRVAVHVTNEPWSAQTLPEPAVEDVLAALNERDIHHVGVQVLSSTTGIGGIDTPLGNRETDVVDDPLLRVQLEQRSAGPAPRTRHRLRRRRHHRRARG